mmetsp:Transcript_35319/g.71545  ORF Transcript_35319/g.71545 Transcript_35319/m.71545 type:complete len:168 (+) Transcript_35319:857-1360(+)
MFGRTAGGMERAALKSQLQVSSGRRETGVEKTHTFRRFIFSFDLLMEPPSPGSDQYTTDSRRSSSLLFPLTTPLAPSRFFELLRSSGSRRADFCGKKCAADHPTMAPSLSFRWRFLRLLASPSSPATFPAASLYCKGMLWRPGPSLLLLAAVFRRFSSSPVLGIPRC